MTDLIPGRDTLQIRVPATPDHTNPGGDIFGGWIMSQVDVGGSLPAVHEAKGPVVTVAVNRFVFLKPVFVGDMVNVYAWVKKVGVSSVTVDAVVFVERNPQTIETIKVAEAELVYVAINEAGKPKPIG